MNQANYDSRTADKFVVRLPDGLRAEIEAAANQSDRSMNSVLIQAVRQYLDRQKRQELLLDALTLQVKQDSPLKALLQEIIDHADQIIDRGGQADEFSLRAMTAKARLVIEPNREEAP
jgi:hypothetical protein